MFMLHQLLNDFIDGINGTCQTETQNKNTRGKMRHNRV